MPTVQAVVALLEGERGYLEKKSNAQLDSKTANAGHNNYTKYTRDIDAAGINDARYQGQAPRRCTLSRCPPPPRAPHGRSDTGMCGRR